VGATGLEPVTSCVQRSRPRSWALRQRRGPAGWGSESLPAALPVRVAASSRAITPAPPLPYSQPTKIPNQLQTLARPDRQRLKPLTRNLLSTQKKTNMQTAVQHNSSHFAPTPDTSLSPTQGSIEFKCARIGVARLAGAIAYKSLLDRFHKPFNWFAAPPFDSIRNQSEVKEV